MYVSAQLNALNEKDRNDTEAQVHNEEISNQPALVRDSIQQYFQQIAPDLQQSLQQTQQAWSKFNEFNQAQGDNLKEGPHMNVPKNMRVWIESWQLDAHSP